MAKTGTGEEVSLEKHEEKTDAIFKTESKQISEQQTISHMTILPPQSFQQKQSGWNKENYSALKERVKAEEKERMFFLGDAREFDTVSIAPLREEKKKIQNRKMSSDQRLVAYYKEIANTRFDSFSFRDVIKKMETLVDFIQQTNGFLPDSEEGLSQVRENRSLLEHVQETASVYIEKHQGSRWKKIQDRVDKVRFIEHHASRALMLLNEVQDVLAEQMARQEDHREIEPETVPPIDNQQLTKKEKGVVSLYSGTGYYAPGGKITNAIAYQWINGILRGTRNKNELPEKGQKEIEKAIETLDQMIGNASLEKTTRLYRGANLEPVFGNTVIENPESLVGKVITDKGYTSTSYRRETSENFISDDLRQTEMINKMAEHYIKSKENHEAEPGAFRISDCLMEITARKGAHGKLLSSSDFKKEKEVLFARDTKMLIKNVEMMTKDVIIEKKTIDTYLREHNKVMSDTEIGYDNYKVHVTVQIPLLKVEIR